MKTRQPEDQPNWVRSTPGLPNCQLDSLKLAQVWRCQIGRMTASVLIVLVLWNFTHRPSASECNGPVHWSALGEESYDARRKGSI